MYVGGMEVLVLEILTNCKYSRAASTGSTTHEAGYVSLGLQSRDTGTEGIYLTVVR
jgi:hypothetical protein